MKTRRRGNKASTAGEIPQLIFDRATVPQPVFTADEVSTWPPTLLADLLRQGVIKPADNAQVVACEACGRDHVEPVIYLPGTPDGGARAFISCPEAGRVPVELDRLRRWTVDVPKLKALTGWTPPRRIHDADAIGLTITEAARFVGVSDRTISKWRKNGKITVVKDKDGHLIFSKSSLQILRDAR